MRKAVLISRTAEITSSPANTNERSAPSLARPVGEPDQSPGPDDGHSFKCGTVPCSPASTTKQAPAKRSRRSTTTKSWCCMSVGNRKFVVSVRERRSKTPTSRPST